MFRQLRTMCLRRSKEKVQQLTPRRLGLLQVKRATLRHGQNIFMKYVVFRVSLSLDIIEDLRSFSCSRSVFALCFTEYPSYFGYPQQIFKVRFTIELKCSCVSYLPEGNKHCTCLRFFQTTPCNKFLCNPLICRRPSETVIRYGLHFSVRPTN